MNLKQWIVDNLSIAGDDFGTPRAEVKDRLKKNITDKQSGSQEIPLADRERVIEKTVGALAKPENLSLFPDIELPPSPPKDVADFALGTVVGDFLLPVVIKTLERIALSEPTSQDHEDATIQATIESLKNAHDVDGSDE